MTTREINIEGEAMRTASIIDLLSASIYDKTQDGEAKPVADYLFALGEIIEDCGARLRRACGDGAEGGE